MKKPDSCLVSCVIPFAAAVFVSALLLLFMAIYLSVYGKDNITYFFKSADTNRYEEAVPSVGRSAASKRGVKI
uniref:Uncharacterized protein n=1 Tax=Ditylenchus dipsaci TaxID=166011 RepID=A0A915DBH9_9BILA